MPRGIRWMPQENLHITLLAPWYEENVSEAVKILRKTAWNTSSFSVRFDQICFMPESSAKFIWAKGDTAQDLLDLRGEIAQTLKRDMEKRQFALHATIARLQKQAAVTPITEVIDWEVEVNSFSLIKSQLFSTGAKYEILETFLLTG